MVASLLFALVLTSQTTIIELDATVGGAKVGHTTYTQIRNSDGAMTTKIDGTLTLLGVTRRGVGTYALRRDGRPVTSEFKGTGGKSSYGHKQTFESTSVKVEELSDDKVTATKRYPIPPNTVLIDPKRDWFSKRMPKKGERASYQSLNNDGKWETRTSTYMGKATLKLPTGQLVAHSIDSGDIKTWVDDQGDLVRSDLVIGGEKVSMIRRSIKRIRTGP